MTTRSHALPICTRPIRCSRTRLADALAADALASEGGGTPAMPLAAGTAAARPPRRTAPLTQKSSVPPQGFCARRTDRRWRCSTPTAGIHTPTKAVRRDSSPDASRHLMQGWQRSARSSGPIWRDTAVLLVTEFGRTAAINGTRGTDHGTAAAAFLLRRRGCGRPRNRRLAGSGGASLYQGRDLAPTLDLRSVLKGLLADHLRCPSRALEDRRCFPTVPPRSRCAAWCAPEGPQRASAESASRCPGRLSFAAPAVAGAWDPERPAGSGAASSGADCA